MAGLRLATLEPNPPRRSLLIGAGLLPARVPLAGPLGPRPEASTVEPRATRIFALTARFDGALTSARAWRRGRPQAITRQGSGLATAPADDSLVRWGFGFDWSSQALAISLWRDGPGARVDALGEAKASGASWAMCWQPADYEIGHWHGLRLRQAARRHARAGEN